MNDGHAAVTELLGAWALDACSAEETATIEDHLAGCPSCSAEADRLGQGTAGPAPTGAPPPGAGARRPGAPGARPAPAAAARHRPGRGRGPSAGRRRAGQQRL